MAAVPTTLLQSKLRPPGTAGSSLRRDRLVDELLSSECKSTLMVAPAGSGKTTLMAQAYEELRRQGGGSGWLTFDASDTDAPELVLYLIRVLLQTGVVDASGEESARLILGGRSPRASLAALLSGAA